MRYRNIVALIRLGKTIRRLREKAKLSVKELATKALMSEQRLRQIEQGGNPLLGTMNKISKALNVEIWELVTEAEKLS